MFLLLGDSTLAEYDVATMNDTVDWSTLSERCREAGVQPEAFYQEKVAELEERKRILVTPPGSWYRDHALAFDGLAQKLLGRALRDEERRVSKGSLAALVERRLRTEEREQLAADYGLRQRLLEEAEGRCCTCGRKLTAKSLEIDHRLPLAEGGSNESVNLQALCSLCNRGKADYFEETAFAAARPWWELRRNLVEGSVRLTEVKRYCALIRARRRCQRCGESAGNVELGVVLRVSKAEGGQAVFDNLTVACSTGCERKER